MTDLPRPADGFTLAAHDGPYETWPLETELFYRGEPTTTEIPGYVLDAAFALNDGYLLVTSWDCPYEEMATFVLLDGDLVVQSRTDVGAPYATGTLKDLVWRDPATLEFSFYGNERWQVTIVGARDRRCLMLAMIDGDED